MNATFKPQDPLQSLSEDQFRLIQTIQTEFEVGMSALNSLDAHSVTVYGGSRVQNGEIAYKTVQNISEKLAIKGWSVVSGGGPGIMTAALGGAEKGGGKSVAFCIDIPGEPPFTNPDITITFTQFSVRKYLLRQSDVFIFAPGGLGTLDELMEVLTLIKTHKHPVKPIFLLDSSFWKGYIEWFNNILILERNVVAKDANNLFYIVDTAEEIIDILYHESKH